MDDHQSPLLHRKGLELEEQEPTATLRQVYTLPHHHHQRDCFTLVLFTPLAAGIAHRRPNSVCLHTDTALAVAAQADAQFVARLVHTIKCFGLENDLHSPSASSSKRFLSDMLLN